MRFPHGLSNRGKGNLPFLIAAVILIHTGFVFVFGAWSAEPTGIASADQVEVIKLASTSRTQADFDRDWRFSQGDFPTAVMPAFEDSHWHRVNLPHDWSIEGPLSPDHASGTGYAPGGIGWYRKHFRVDLSATGKIVMIEFDGVYDHSEVWVNGQYVGGRPYGYSSFECDLTPYLKFGLQENVVAVRVDHSRLADSRWYTGSGIYRHVRLRITDKLRIAHWGTYVTTPEVKENSAVIRIETMVENNAGTTKKLSLQSEIITPDGHVAGNLITSGSLDNNTQQSIVQQITIERPQPWTLEAPRLYTLRSRLSVDSTAVDETTTAFGIRTLRFDPDHGFFLNGTPMKLKGVCIHHDAGCLGAAVPEKVLERRLRLLKELGVNAIRTSHNPPAPELLDLCDRLGLLVKDEAFDEFMPGKNKWVTGWNNGLPARFGYAKDFQEWSVRDIQDLIRRDRNHPSVILWSIGNEIDYANDPFSHPILGKEYHPENPPAENLVKQARPLIEAVKNLDRTRPVTAALANVAMSDAVGLGELLDVVGYNYQELRYPSDHVKYPQRFIFGSENSHSYSDWAVVRDNDYIAGQFLWTGIDYLGEANRWPNHGNEAGLLDLCGFKKPLAWFRQSLWSSQPMVYLCAASEDGVAGRGRLRGEESWNWPSNSMSITVHCFTTCPEVALTLNDKSLGTKKLSEATDGTLVWQVPFEPGVLRAVGRQGDKPVCEFVLKTAGTANRIELLPDVTQLSADGRDICHVEFHIVDSQGVCVPDAGNELTFELDGPAEILGIENSDLNSPESYKTRMHKAYHGRGLAILQSSAAAGKITLTATSPGINPASVILNSK
jgi:beta-galactosidase